MEIKMVRVEKLKSFVQEKGGPAAVARKFNDVDASYLSQLINGHRPFGEKSARNLENKFSLPPLYFDTLEAQQERGLYVVQQIYENMDEKTRQQWIAIGNTLAEPKPENNGHTQPPQRRRPGM